MELYNWTWYNNQGIITEWKVMDETGKEKPREPRRENPIFTIWVHTGYAVLILSMIAWMIYLEFFM